MIKFFIGMVWNAGGASKALLVSCVVMVCHESSAFQRINVLPSLIRSSELSRTLTKPMHRISCIRPALSLRAKPDDEQAEIQQKWSTPVENETAERIESVKSGIISALFGSLVMTPFALVTSKSFYPADAFSAQWEISHDGLAVMLALFGLVYRYAVRKVA